MSCPCGAGVALGACCGRFLDAGQRPETAEQLMRSRYSAYVLKRALYLRESWHPRTRPKMLDLDGAHWLGLSVLAAADQDADHATVEFVARYRDRSGAHELREHSRFERWRGAWVYVDAL